MDRIRIERGRSLPSPRILLILFGASLLLMAAGGATGLSARAATLGAFGILVGELVALAIEPVLVIPFASVFLFISAAALVLASFVTASLAALERLSWLPALHPVALAVATLGFVVWSTVTLFPLYEGGHFVYHSSIAEEIWQGRFMHYYLPSPRKHAEPPDPIGITPSSRTRAFTTRSCLPWRRFRAFGSTRSRKSCSRECWR